MNRCTGGLSRRRAARPPGWDKDEIARAAVARSERLFRQCSLLRSLRASSNDRQDYALVGSPLLLVRFRRKRAGTWPIEHVGIAVLDSVPESRQDAALPICDEEFARVIALDHDGRRGTARDDLL